MVKVDRRIRWHYTTTILRLRIGARLTRYRDCKFHNFARTISRHADGISRYSVPPSAGPLLPMRMLKIFCKSGPRSVWNNPLACNCSAAWLRDPADCLPALSADHSPPTDRCLDDSPEGASSHLLTNVDFSDCGLSVDYSCNRTTRTVVLLLHDFVQ